MKSAVEQSIIRFQGQEVVQLRDAQNEVLISPGHGARVLRWTVRGREVITWPEGADWQSILKVRGGNPVLFPFVARHFVDGINEKWRDAAGTIRPLPQHGFARDAAFAIVEAADPATLRMRLGDSAATRDFYPFAFTFDVTVTLHERARLEIEFTTTNRGAEPLPYYAGHHFYFALPHAERADWRLHLPCASWAQQEAGGGIVHEEPVTESLNLGDPTLLDRFHVHPLTAELILEHGASGRRLGLELQDAKATAPWFAVTTWTQTPESDFYCIEPWLGLPNAIHHREGLRWVAPGTTERAICILDASGW